MTDEEKAALREDIENLTIKQARARAETATETLRVLAELGIGDRPIATRAGVIAEVARLNAHLPAQPFPCQQCGRTGPIQPNEAGGPQECIACGNPLPLQNGARMTNKGPIGLTAEERAWKLAQPAFNKDGDPIA